MFHTLLDQLTILATLHQRYDEVEHAEYEVLKPDDLSCTATRHLVMLATLAVNINYIP